MKTTLSLSLLLLVGFTAKAQTSTPSADLQIKTAVQAAPSEKRDGAMVYGYGPDGKFTVLRKGTNDMVCLADDPNQKGINVSCYHKDLDPFMARGRELKQAGKSAKESNDMREAEAKSGKLKMPLQPTSLFVYTGTDENLNATTGEVKDGYLRYVVYIPNATAESTGLPLKPDAPGMPWIMDPGTYRAHIMISPPKQ
ncbi:hypothetical protein [Telluribacter sp. SYSU D00476]|uniref:hypothetical protein n=1 Tax=Telluribacter sp. SYSU D00476 TaxID=2811430 RepID=UPI001FF64B9A|nr:hypothetical protein [Telluribacter sp. SYSU D00476]